MDERGNGEAVHPSRFEFRRQFEFSLVRTPVARFFLLVAAVSRTFRFTIPRQGRALP